jgi:hypothetical protein
MQTSVSPAASASSLPSALPVAVKSKLQTTTAMRGQQASGKTSSGRGGAEKTSSQSLSPAVYNCKQAVEPLAGATKVRSVATFPPSGASQEASQDGGSNK